MKNKTIFTLLTVFFVLSSVISPVFAADHVTSSSILPNNPFYFFKDVGREIQNIFTFNPTKKAELRLDIANEKLQEIEYLIDENGENVKYLEVYEKALEKVEEQTNILDSNNPATNTLLEKVANYTFEHQERLEKLKEKSSSDKIEALEDKAIKVLTKSSFDVAPELMAKEKMQEKFQVRIETNSRILEKIEEHAPEKMKIIANNVRTRIQAQNQKENAPSSTNCIQKGNRLEIKKSSDGSEHGICISPSGETCEEWAYFRGECVFE